jgi:hypothetical protein
MEEPVRKRVDESWKEQAEREKHVVGQAPSMTQTAQPSLAQAAGRVPPAPPRPEEPTEPLEARFDLFLSGLMMEALIALGEMPNPATRQQQASLPRAKYLIDLLGILEEKTKGNLLAEEETLLKDALYQLRMRYLAKAQR